MSLFEDAKSYIDTNNLDVRLVNNLSYPGHFGNEVLEILYRDIYVQFVKDRGVFLCSLAHTDKKENALNIDTVIKKIKPQSIKSITTVTDTFTILMSNYDAILELLSKS